MTSDPMQAAVPQSVHRDDGRKSRAGKIWDGVAPSAQAAGASDHDGNDMNGGNAPSSGNINEISPSNGDARERVA